MKPIEPVALSEIEAARVRLHGIAVRTPLVRLNLTDAPAEIYLKLENLQPIGAFKIRGAGNAMLSANPARLADGVYTASAGNMAQGVAWMARYLGLPCRVIVPDQAPATKLEAIERLGGKVIKVPFDRWWQTLVEHQYPGLKGLFVHPVANPAVIAGNGTIGLEILDDLPDVDTLIIPFGGGGLSSGIASAIRAKKPATKIFGAEVETSTPLTAALAADEPRVVERTPSFVDGIGGKGVLPEMWPLVKRLLDGALVVTLRQIADAIMLMVERNRVVAEGAGGAPVAAALAGQAGAGKVVCVVSGGNLDTAKLTTILAGAIP